MELYTLAEKHNISHIVADVLLRDKLIDNEEIAYVYKINVMKAVSMNQKIVQELSVICAFLEENQICHMPLKGSVIRSYYIKDWYRSSSDIDILVKKDDVDKVRELVEDRLGYVLCKEGPHDVSYISKSKVNVEIHFELVEQDGESIGRAYRKWNAKLLTDIWERVLLQENTRYQYVMRDRDFYFYHVAHMAKHFENGGCGVRSIIDLYLLDRADGRDETSRREALLSGGLVRFADAVSKLSMIWFEDDCHDDLTLSVEEFILHGGVFGSPDNKVAYNAQKRGGKIRYMLSRLFMPYKLLKTVYPSLERHRWMYPFYIVRRWIDKLILGDKERVSREFMASVSNDKNEEKKQLEKLGL